jgi:hypothetical protein
MSNKAVYTILTETPDYSGHNAKGKSGYGFTMPDEKQYVYVSGETFSGKWLRNEVSKKASLSYRGAKEMTTFQHPNLPTYYAQVKLDAKDETWVRFAYGTKRWDKWERSRQTYKEAIKGYGISWRVMSGPPILGAK